MPRLVNKLKKTSFILNTEMESVPLKEDWVSELQIFCQKARIGLPSYRFTVECSSTSIEVFIATVKISELAITVTGESGCTKKEAKQNAAHRAYDYVAKLASPPLLPLVSKEINMNHARVMLVDVANFPLFLSQIPSSVLPRCPIYAFSYTPIQPIPTGVIVIVPTAGITSPRITHSYLSVYLGSLLAKLTENTTFIIVAGDKLANDLIHVVNDSNTMALSAFQDNDAVQCKNVKDLPLLMSYAK